MNPGNLVSVAGRPRADGLGVIPGRNGLQGKGALRVTTRASEIMILSLAVVLIAFGGSVATAAPADGIVVLGAEGWRAEPPPLSVRSGEVLPLDILLPRSLDRSTVSVALWQASGRVVLPLGEAHSLDELSAADAADSQGITRLNVTFPKLERKTQVLVVFTTKSDSPTKLGTARVLVYPRLDWAPLAAKLNKEGPRLLVFGEGMSLRDFFRSRDLAFGDYGNDLPERIDRETLSIGALSFEDWTDRQDRLASDGGRLIVFVADLVALPGVYTTTLGEGGVITKVTLPALASLAQDPRSEELLFQLIEQHLQSAPVAIP